jgi:alpha-beta hydrolase superfamily lysophospholipase
MTSPMGEPSIFHESSVLSGGVRLVVRTHTPAGPIRAEVVITHGLGEHAGRYGHVAARFGKEGLRTTVYDLRGHGRSEGRRGDAPSYDALLDDVAAVIGTIEDSGRPRFLMGHSLGAQITMNYLLARAPVCAGVIAASPWLRLAFRPAAWRISLARAISRWWPTFMQPAPSSPEKLSRDLDHLMSLPNPELRHHRISARLFFAVVEGGERALAQAGECKTPIFLLHGGDDPVTSAEASQEFYERAATRDKEFRLYPGTRHETHNDLDRERVLADVIEWMQKHIPS